MGWVWNDGPTRSPKLGSDSLKEKMLFARHKSTFKRLPILEVDFLL